MQPLPLVLVPGPLCSARLYAAQIAALWPNGQVTIADHRRDDAKDFFLTVFNGRLTWDKCGPHNDLLEEFPYLGPPHETRQ
jgi:hypothetical protein